MKLPITAALILALAACTGASRASDPDSGTVLVPNNHGGYNVADPSVKGGDASLLGTILVPNNHGGYNVANPNVKNNSLPFFGAHGFAANVAAHAHDKPVFILRPVVEDVGHGGKIVVYKKIYFATAEEAEAAKLKFY